MRNRIREILYQQKRTQNDLALEIGVNPSYLSDVARGRVTPGGDKMLAISRALGRPVEEVFYEDEEKTA